MYKKLLTISLILLGVKVFIAYFLELGNDEVYYYTYAKNLQLSYFDHPAMIGLLAWISTFGLEYTSAINLRFFPLLFGFLNPFILYNIVLYLKDKKAAFITAILYLSTIYASILSGVFILPDAPLSFFVLIALYFGVKVVKNNHLTMLIPFSVFLAFALFSKYQAVFIGFGMMFYILKFKPLWLKKPILWISVAIAFLGIIPTLLWNIEHNWINFNFHSNRVGDSSLLEYFPREIFGQIFYQNPIVFILITISLFKLKKVSSLFSKEVLWFLLSISLPLIFTSIFLSLCTESLPHWSGIAYIGLLIISGIIISHTSFSTKKVYYALGFLFFLMIIGYIEVQNGYISNIKTRTQTLLKKGKNDATQDVYGWKQLNTKFKYFLQKQNNKNTLIIAQNWYPAAHLEYYLAQPNNLELICIGEKKNTHQYSFKNNDSILKKNNYKAYCITQTTSGFNVYNYFKNKFIITPLDTLPITRRNDTIRYHFIYQLEKK